MHYLHIQVDNPGYKYYIDIKILLYYDVASESEITPCIKIDKPLVVYTFTGNVMTFITTLRTKYKVITFYARNEISK